MPGKKTLVKGAAVLAGIWYLAAQMPDMAPSGPGVVVSPVVSRGFCNISAESFHFPKSECEDITGLSIGVDCRPGRGQPFASRDGVLLSRIRPLRRAAEKAVANETCAAIGEGLPFPEMAVESPPPGRQMIIPHRAPPPKVEI